MLTRIALIGLILVPLALLTGSADAGPPCVCWPIDVGDAPVIEVDGRGGAPRDTVAKLLGSLDGKLPVLARMENLRRAALALQGNSNHADHVLSRLLARVLDAETGQSQELAKRWFDAGYAVSCFREAGQVTDLDGYPWITRAIELSGANNKLEGGDGAMHFAAGLSVLMPGRRDHDRFQHHLRQMKAAAENDALLTRNFASLARRYPPLLRYFADKKK